MNTLLIGNALCFIASIIMTLMGLIKKKRRFILAQSGMNAVFIVGNLTLGGISGAIVNLVTLLRNFVCLKFEMTKLWKIIFIALQIGLTAYFGCDSIIMWFPVIGACVFTWFMDTENMLLLKIIVIVSQLLWAVYDFSIRNYATVPFDIASAVTNTISIFGIIKDRKAAQ
ncbi:MAG: YgjV family protein [Eubacteriales bacterium]|nr:YgjV family protein [Eubacteriales bacterium]